MTRQSRFLLTAVLLFCLPALAVLAQFDPGEKDIFQFEEKVGVLWVPDRVAGACTYQEHWYLFPDYRYPGREDPVETVLKEGGERHFESVEQFVATMDREHPGGRHITTVAIEHRADCP